MHYLVGLTGTHACNQPVVIRVVPSRSVPPTTLRPTIIAAGSRRAMWQRGRRRRVTVATGTTLPRRSHRSPAGGAVTVTTTVRYYLAFCSHGQSPVAHAESLVARVVCSVRVHSTEFARHTEEASTTSYCNSPPPPPP